MRSAVIDPCFVEWFLPPNTVGWKDVDERVRCERVHVRLRGGDNALLDNALLDERQSGTDVMMNI